MRKQKARNQLIIFIGAVFCITLLAGASKPVAPGLPGQPIVPVAKEDRPDTSESSKSGNSRGRVVAIDEARDGRPTQVEKTVALAPPKLSKKPAITRHGLAPRDFIAIDNKTYPVQTYQALSLPNDPLADQSWVTNSNLSNAWAIVPGSYQTTLAVIDTGFALNHEEFQNRWYQNSGEVGPVTTEAPSKLNCTARGLALDYSCNLVDDTVDGVVDNESGAAPYENKSQLNCTARSLPLDKSCNRIDDDGNSYVDDVTGWDMVNQDNSPQAGELSPAGTGTVHGTMVSGVAAASGNNGKGIAGANWNTKILPIQALDDDSYGDTYTVGKAIYYAINRNVDVINVSLGSSADDPYVRQAVEAATAAGILVVASSGNDGCDCVAYPAHYPEVLAVGATDETNTIAGFSSYGTSVDMVAPGTNFTVPSWSQSNPTARYVTGVSGTSFSSPLVAGLAASLKSQQPAATPLHLIAALHETAFRSNNVTSSPQDAHYGYGRIDAVSATNRMTTIQHQTMLYILSPVLAGTYFNGSSLEKASGYSVMDCQSTPRNIRIYEAIKGSERFYTISEVERRKAESLGFTTPLFANACLRQPQDTTDTIRFINIFREFRNLDPVKM